MSKKYEYDNQDTADEINEDVTDQAEQVAEDIKRQLDEVKDRTTERAKKKRRETLENYLEKQSKKGSQNRAKPNKKDLLNNNSGDLGSKNSNPMSKASGSGSPTPSISGKGVPSSPSGTGGAGKGLFSKLGGKGIGSAGKGAGGIGKLLKGSGAGLKKGTLAAAKAIKTSLMALAKVGKVAIAGTVKAIAAFWPVILIALAVLLVVVIVLILLGDSEYESKAHQDNYQNETIDEENELVLNPETGRYDTVAHSDGNKMFKMFYGFIAERGYWKVIVDDDGNPITDLYRADSRQAEEIVDRYNRERNFVMNSDMLYLLDSKLNTGNGLRNQFHYPEQFVQPVPYDENFNLKDVTNEDDEVVLESTKYTDDGRPTNEKVPGVWDYGFGSILQYREFQEEREKRANLKTTYECDYDEKERVLVHVEDGEEITESVSGYPRDTHMISKVTLPVGSIENTIRHEWVRTQEPWTKVRTVEIEAEEEEEYIEIQQATNDEGELLYYYWPPIPIFEPYNYVTTEERIWKVMEAVTKTRWVDTTIEVEETYEGYVWEKIPRYEGEPNTDGIIGDRYFFDYLTNYEAYVPDIAMQEFDVQERLGRDIDELEYLFAQQTTNNQPSAYDRIGNDDEVEQEDFGDLSFGSALGGSNAYKYQNATRYLDLFEIYGNRYGVDPYLLLAISAQESAGKDDIDHSRYGRAGVGLMQVIASTGQGGINATNLETGERDRQILETVHDHTAEGTIQFAAMYMQFLG